MPFRLTSSDSSFPDRPRSESRPWKSPRYFLFARFLLTWKRWVGERESSVRALRLAYIFSVRQSGGALLSPECQSTRYVTMSWSCPTDYLHCRITVDGCGCYLHVRVWLFLLANAECVPKFCVFNHTFSKFFKIFHIQGDWKLIIMCKCVFWVKTKI